MKEKYLNIPDCLRNQDNLRDEKIKDLKECPFCGGEALYKEVSEDWYRIIVDHKKGCLLCDSALNYSQTLNAMIQLTKDWNTRNSVPASELQVLMHQTNQVWSWVGCEDALKHITEDLQKLIDDNNG